MSKVKELVEGALENIAEEEIVANSLYNITDFPIGGITNAQMVAALSVEQSGFYKENSVYLCVDNNGTYLKNHLYRFAGSSWVDATPVFVNGGKYEHTINVVNGTTPSGTWNYQFKFLDDNNTPYTSLADVGTHLYDTYGNAKIDASGTYIDSNSQTYLVISVRGTSNNMVEIEYVKLSDGIVSTTTSELLAVVDSVH